MWDDDENFDDLDEEESPLVETEIEYETDEEFEAHRRRTILKAILIGVVGLIAVLAVVTVIALIIFFIKRKSIVALLDDLEKKDEKKDHVS